MNMTHDLCRPVAIAADASQIDQLYAKLGAARSRRVRRLMEAGRDKMARKLVEEATEAALDAVKGNRQGLIDESVDILYHLTVLWRECGVDPAEIWAEMARRDADQGICGKLPKRRGAAMRAAARIGEMPRAPHYRRGDTIGPVPLDRLAAEG